MGRGFVIARVETIKVPTPEMTASWPRDESGYQEFLALEPIPPRWFIARVR